MYRYSRESTEVKTMKCAACGVRLPYKKMYNQSVSACSEACLSGAFSKFMTCQIEGCIAVYTYNNRRTITEYYKSAESDLYHQIIETPIPRY